MNIETYFEQPDTPAKHSPVGTLMVRVLAKNPGMGFEQARAEANRLLDVAAGHWKFTIPRVLSAEEQAGERARLRVAFGRSGTVQEVA